MGTIFQPPLVKLIVGLLWGQSTSLDQVKERLQRDFGAVDAQSEIWDFNYTDYYEDELGRDLLRVFLSFDGCMSASDLAAVKGMTNAMEQEFAQAGKRTVNIDPGYVTLSKLVVASTKDATYRVHLDRGIFAQSMLYFEKGTYRNWPWTYQDYCDEKSILFFNRVRSIWQAQAKEGKMEPLKSQDATQAPQRPLRWYQGLPYLIVMIFFVLGPFALPLLWKSPALKRPAKIVLTLLTLAWTVYVCWYLLTKGQMIVNMYKDMNQFVLDANR